MSNDGYVAICKPLHYMTIVSNRICKKFVLCCWARRLFIIIIPFSLGWNLEFHVSNVADHFLCDVSSSLKISCSHTHSESRWLQLVLSPSPWPCACSTFPHAYHRDNPTISSCPAKKKALFTCPFHMTFVSITYGSCIFIYIKSQQNEKWSLVKVLSVIITSLTPVLKPFIFSLRKWASETSILWLNQKKYIFSKK